MGVIGCREAQEVRDPLSTLHPLWLPGGQSSQELLSAQGKRAQHSAGNLASKIGSVVLGSDTEPRSALAPSSVPLCPGSFVWHVLAPEGKQRLEHVSPGLTSSAGRTPVQRRQGPDPGPNNTVFSTAQLCPPTEMTN